MNMNTTNNDMFEVYMPMPLTNLMERLFRENDSNFATRSFLIEKGINTLNIESYKNFIETEYEPSNKRYHSAIDYFTEIVISRIIEKLGIDASLYEWHYIFSHSVVKIVKKDKTNLVDSPIVTSDEELLNSDISRYANKVCEETNIVKNLEKIKNNINPYTNTNFYGE